MHSKYFIYIQILLKNSTVGFYSCMTMIKLALEEDNAIYKQNNKVRKFNKVLFLLRKYIGRNPSPYTCKYRY